LLRAREIDVAKGDFDRLWGRLICPQPVKVTSGVHSGSEGIILDDKSSGYYKVNVTPEKATVEDVDIHESDLKPIERLSIYTTTIAAT
jgi:hypothetical protein